VKCPFCWILPAVECGNWIILQDGELMAFFSSFAGHTVGCFSAVSLLLTALCGMWMSIG
jgi:hypothetical protein